MSMESVTNETQLDHILKNSVFMVIILALLLGIASAQTVSPPPFSAGSVEISGSLSGIRAGHILVRFKTPPARNVLDQLDTAYGAKAVGKIPGIGVTHLQASSERGLGLLEHLRKRSDVQFAEFDYVVKTFLDPNDPYYSTPDATSHNGSIAQWGPPAVSAPAAWDVTQGDSRIVIAVVDTGVDSSHPDLASKIVGEYSYVGRSAKDGFGHGTHVAGIAAAATNNSTGVAGMCPNCGILSVKVLNDQGSGYMSDVASGIIYAASHGARVINLSLGGSGHSETMRAALQYAVTHNALPVCAMGNSNSSTNTPEPAYWYDCLSVIATEADGTRASFSNYGIKADVAAPGRALLSTMPTYTCTLNGYGYYNNYDALSGTSMATPMMAGIAGLVLSRNPNLTPAQVRGIIEAAAGDGATWTPDLGFGIVNAAKAVSAAVHSDYTAPNANLTDPNEGSTVSSYVSVHASPVDDSGVHHIDLLKDGTRFLQPLVGVTVTSGKGKNATTTQPWTLQWPSTTVFNGPATLSAVAVDVFGNPSPVLTRSFNVQNRLVSQSWTQALCSPSTSTCPNTVWLPVTTGATTEAATHLQGTVSYSLQKNVYSSSFWLQVSGSTESTTFAYYCGTNGTTVDCYPPFPFGLYPDSTRNYSNYSGGQINANSSNKNPASEAGTIHWTLTYPQ
jgi:thermitase